MQQIPDDPAAMARVGETMVLSTHQMIKTQAHFYNTNAEKGVADDYMDHVMTGVILGMMEYLIGANLCQSFDEAADAIRRYVDAGVHVRGGKVPPENKPRLVILP